jgi:hypothetical protein
MRKENQPSLPEWIEDAYQPIEQHLQESTEENSVTPDEVANDNLLSDLTDQ